MNSFERPESEGADRLGEAIRQLPLPQTPAGIESRVRGSLRLRRLRQISLTGSVAAPVLVGLLLWRPWAGNDGDLGGGGPVPSRQAASSRSRPIDVDELDVLFAPPPVDPLAVLDRQQEACVRTLSRLEGKE